MPEDKKQASRKEVGLQPGAMVDHYRIIRPVGAGGMAEVYLARDTVLGRKIALKIIQPKRTKQKEAVDRFLFEAKATARFNHPHIVTIHGVGVTKEGPYLALEYLEGQTLRNRLEQERLSEKETIRIGISIADALVVAHKKELLHRDLKPENIMMAQDGRLRILDFGLSRLLGDEISIDADSLEKSGKDKVASVISSSKHQKLRGTPAYMAPEQWKTPEIGPPADVWALGLMMYEMLVGRHPFHEVKGLADLASRVCSQDPVPSPVSLGQYSFDLVVLINRCLAKNPDERPTAEEIWHELNSRLQGDTQETLTGISPFRGLVPFEEEHSGLFFGRETEVTSFVEKLRHDSILPVVGPSGAGKSSFIKAGVIPRLREKGPLILIQLRPGRNPFLTLASHLVNAQKQTLSPFGTSSPMGSINRSKQDAPEETAKTIEDPKVLANRLSANPHRLGLLLHQLAEQHRAYVVLFVDQLEELCSFGLDDGHIDINSQRGSQESAGGGLFSKFMQAITTAADDPELPVRVVLTLREEFLTRLMTSTQVRESLSRITVLRKPSPKTLVDILERSVKAVGYKYDDYLLAQDLVTEAVGSQSTFSLLQFAGQVMWENRDKQRRVLTRAVYEDMGGVTGALVQHADGVLKGLTNKETEIAKELLLRLVTEDRARRIMGYADLLAGLQDGAQRVLSRLVESRLVTISRRTHARSMSDGNESTKTGGADQQTYVEDENEGDYELVHEALIDQWDLLNHWIDENREELRLLNQLEQAALLWHKRGRQLDELWRAKALKEVEVLFAQKVSYNRKVSEFIDQSRKQIRLGKTKRWAAFCLSMVVVGLAFWVGSNLFSLKAQDGLCQGAKSYFVGVWDKTTKNTIAARFSQSGLSFAASIWKGVEDTLDTYAKDWSKMHSDSCAATHIRKELSETLLDARMFCLSQRLWETQALVEILKQSDPNTIKNAFQAATKLTSVASCADVDVLSSRKQLPKDDQTRTKINTIRRKVSRAMFLGETGKHQHGLQVAQQAVVEAKQIAYQPITAEALYTLSRLWEDDRDYDNAEETLKQSLLAAKQGKHSKLVTSIYNRMIYVTGYLRSKPDIAKYIADIAYASLADQQYRQDGLAEWHNNIGIVYQTTGNQKKAQFHLSQAMQIWNQLYGFEHPKVAACANNLAIAYRKQGQYQKAIDLHTKSLESMKRNLGPLYPSLAEPLTGLGIAFRLQRNFDQALQHQLQALAIREGVLGKDHLDVAYLLNNLSVLYNDMQDFEKALSIQQRVLSIRTKGLDNNHPDLAESHTNLGIIYNAKADHGQALDHFRKSQDILEQIYGADHPKTVQAIKHVAFGLDLTGKHQQAIQNYQRALRILKTHYGAQSLEVAQFLIDLGQVYKKTSNSKKSISSFDSAMAILEKTKGSDHPDVAKALNHIASVYEDSQDYTKAISYRRKAFDILVRLDDYDGVDTLEQLIIDYYKSKKTIKPNTFFTDILQTADPEQITQVLVKYSDKLASSKKYSSSISVLSRALTIQQRNLGKHHPNTVASLASLCRLQKRSKQYRKSRDCYQNLLQITKDNPTEQHDREDTLYNHAFLSHMLGDYEKGVASYQQVLAIWTRTLGPDSIKVANALFNLGSLFYDKQDYANASDKFRRVISIWKKTAKLDASQASKTHRYMGDIAQKQQKPTEAIAHYQSAVDLLGQDMTRHHQEAYDILNKLGEANRLLNEPDKASDYYRQALELSAKFDPNPSKQAFVQYQLGEIENARDNFERARKYYQESYKNWSSAQSGNEINLAIVSINLGDLAFVQEDWKTSRSHYQSGLLLLADQTEPYFSKKTKCLYNLGISYKKTGEIQLAYQHLKRALDMRIKNGGQDTMNLATNCLNLGVVAQELNKPKQAVAYLRRSLGYLEQTENPKPQEIFRILEKIASVQLVLGDVGNAIQVLKRALATKRSSLGQYDSESIRCLAQLIKAYRNQGQTARGLKFYSESLPLLQNALKLEDNTLPYLFIELGHAFKGNGQYDRALANYQHALLIREKEVGKSSPNLNPILQNMAVTYEKKGDYENMSSSLKRVLAIRAKHLDPTHPDLAETYKALGYALYLRRSYTSAKENFEKSIAIYKRFSPQVVPELEFVVAKLLWSIGDEKDRAIKLANKSYRALKKMKKNPRVQNQIKKWILQKSPR